MLFALGTTNIPKTNAVRAAFESASFLSGVDWSIEGFKVPSGVPDMPLTLHDLRLGAKNRAHEVQKLCPHADYFLGMEGGVYQDHDGKEYWLTGVTYMMNSAQEGHYGYSCHMPVPPYVAKQLHDGSGRDLEQIMEELGAEKGIGDREGSFAVWSDNMITRTDQFRLATQCAMVPFFNKYYSIEEDKNSFPY